MNKHTLQQKLKLLRETIRGQTRWTFQNSGIQIVVETLQNNPSTATILGVLESKYKNHEDIIKNIFDGTVQLSKSIADIKELEETIAFWWQYIKIGSLQTNRGLVFGHFVSLSGFGDSKPQDREKNKNFFIKNAIFPLLSFVENTSQSTRNALYILNRYRILCEWYDRETVLDLVTQKELKVTQGHLDRFLFNQGFRFSLSEVSVDKSRLDNFCISESLDKNKLPLLPDVILAEAKRVRKGKGNSTNKKVIRDVKNQTMQKLRLLNLTEGFSVVFNETDRKITIENKTDAIDGVPYIEEQKKRIYFVIISLHDSFKDSKYTHKELKVSIA